MPDDRRRRVKVSVDDDDLEDIWRKAAEINAASEAIMSTIRKIKKAR